MISDFAALQLASSELVAAANRLDPSALDRRTPCDEWTVTQLLDHVTGGNRFTISILAGASATDAMQAAIDSFGNADTDTETDTDTDADADRGGDGDDGPGCGGAVASLVASTRDQLDAFDHDGVFDRTCDHVVGSIGAADVIRLRVHDLVLHTWDLNKATGADPGFAPAMTSWCCAELARPDSLTARSLKLAGHTPTDASELLAVFGRDESFSP